MSYRYRLLPCMHATGVEGENPDQYDNDQDDSINNDLHNVVNDNDENYDNELVNNDDRNPPGRSSN